VNSYDQIVFNIEANTANIESLQKDIAYLKAQLSREMAGLQSQITRNLKLDEKSLSCFTSLSFLSIDEEITNILKANPLRNYIFTIVMTFDDEDNSFSFVDPDCLGQLNAKNCLRNPCHGEE
jgi:hypothetical protein